MRAPVDGRGSPAALAHGPRRRVPGYRVQRRLGVPAATVDARGVTRSSVRHGWTCAAPH